MCELGCIETTMKVFQIMNMVGSLIMMVAALIYLPIFLIPGLQQAGMRDRHVNHPKDPDDEDRDVSPQKPTPGNSNLFYGALCSICVFTFLVLFCLNFIGYKGMKKRNKSLMCAFTMGYYIVIWLSIVLLVCIHLTLSRRNTNLDEDFRDYAKDINARKAVDNFQMMYKCCGTEEVNFRKRLRPLPASCCYHSSDFDDDYSENNPKKNDYDDDIEEMPECTVGKSSSTKCSLTRYPGGLGSVFGMAILFLIFDPKGGYIEGNDFGRHAILDISREIYYLSIYLIMQIGLYIIYAIFGTLIVVKFAKSSPSNRSTPRNSRVTE